MLDWDETAVRRWAVYTLRPRPAVADLDVLCERHVKGWDFQSITLPLLLAMGLSRPFAEALIDAVERGAWDRRILRSVKEVVRSTWLASDVGKWATEVCMADRSDALALVNAGVDGWELESLSDAAMEDVGVSPSGIVRINW